MATRAVLLDLGNTLIAYYRRDEFSAVLRRCVHEVVRAAGLSETEVNEAELFERAQDLNRESPDFAVLPLPGRLRELLPGCAHFQPELMERVCQAFMAPIFSCAQVDPDAVPLPDALRARGLRTAVVSNTPWGSSAEYWREELSRHGLLARLDAAVFCVDVGWRKPHPAAMRRALEQLGVAADEIIFVGDDPEWDIEGARRAGIRPVLLSCEPDAAPPNCDMIGRLGSLLELVAPDGGAKS